MDLSDFEENPLVAAYNSPNKGVSLGRSKVLKVFRVDLI